ncbi:MAG: hypothetical protein NT129_01920 [Candidatus Aenigmarchaeota archaeon]|nr:hypothetical protein [Candidatus Aenigmarchaeota archaeon]
MAGANIFKDSLILRDRKLSGIGKVREDREGNFIVFSFSDSMSTKPRRYTSYKDRVVDNLAISSILDEVKLTEMICDEDFERLKKHIKIRRNDF